MEEKKQYENIVLATHAFLVDGNFNVRSGPTASLLEYFLPKCKRFFLIGQPPPYVEGTLAPFLFVYESGVFKKAVYNKWFYAFYDIPEGKRRVTTSFKLKLRDLFSVLYFSSIIREKIGKESVDYFIGVESVNAIAAAFVKIFIPIKSSIYYAFDWSVKWFNNFFFNFIYIQFDRWACRFSDFSWNASHRIEEARKDVLKYKNRVLGKQLTVPFGMMTFRESLVSRIPPEGLNTIIYCGELSYENGALLLPAIAKYLWEIKPSLKLIVIGGGDLFDSVKKEIYGLRLTNVELKGHLSNQLEIDKILVTAHVAIAPYITLPYSKKRFGDVVKIRNYFACGLPVVTTNVPPISDEILRESLGTIVPPQPEEIAAQCITLLENRAKYLSIRKNVIEKAKGYNWKMIYNETIGKMEGLRRNQLAGQRCN